MQVRTFNIDDANLQIKKQDLYDDFDRKVRDYDPDIIAVSVVDDTVAMGLKLIRHLKLRRAVTVFGGVHAIFNAGSLIERDEVDIVCIGEGEEALVDLCENIASKVAYTNIRNLWVKDERKQIFRNPMRNPVDIDTLPYEDFSIFDEENIFRPMQGKMVASIPINFDRGCPYHCTFCAAPSILDMYKKNQFIYYRTKTINRIYKEMKHFSENYPVSFFYFNSETFLSMPFSKLEEFADMYSEFKLPFWCQTRVETVTEDKIELLKEMNCLRISIGLEHGNEDFRKNILRKDFTNKQVMEAFRIIKKYNIPTSVNNMIGFPDETRELVFDTIDLNRVIESDAVNGFVFQPYSGTYLYDYSVEKGYLKDYDEMINSGGGTPNGHSFLDMPQFSREEIEGLLRTFALYVRMPNEYYPKIRCAERSDDEGNRILGDLKDIFFQKYLC